MARILILVLLTLTSFSGGLQAQEPVLPEQVDVRIIVDISGSMKKRPVPVCGPLASM